MTPGPHDALLAELLDASRREHASLEAGDIEAADAHRKQRDATFAQLEALVAKQPLTREHAPALRALEAQFTRTETTAQALMVTTRQALQQLEQGAQLLQYGPAGVHRSPRFFDEAA